MTVFLGGTCNGSMWRDALIDKLKIYYFNPVVDIWTGECHQEEIRQKGLCGFLLYTITPKMKSVYRIAEVIDDSNKRPSKTILCVLETDITLVDNERLRGTSIETWSREQRNDLQSVMMMVHNNGAHVFTSLNLVADFLNSQKGN